MNYVNVLTDGSIFKRITWDHKRILLRALSTYEVEWITRELNFLGVTATPLDLACYSVYVFDGSFCDDWSLSFRRTLAERLNKLPASFREELVQSYQTLQASYFEGKTLFHSFMTSLDSRVIWDLYGVHGEGVFRKIHLWNDYQSEWMVFNRREDDNTRLDIILSGIKFLASCWAKVPEDIQGLKLSMVQHEEGVKTSEIDRLEEEMKNYAEGVKDDHERVIESAEIAFKKRMEEKQQELEELRQKTQSEIPDTPGIMMISPEALVEKSRKRRKSRLQ